MCSRGQERLERKRVAKEEDRVSVEKGGQHSFRRYVVGVAGSGRKRPRQGREERATSPYITSRRGILRVAQPVASSGGHRAYRGGLGLRVLPRRPTLAPAQHVAFGQSLSLGQAPLRGAVCGTRRAWWVSEDRRKDGAAGGTRGGDAARDYPPEHPLNPAERHRERERYFSPVDARGSLGPCILFAVVKSARWARQTDLGPGPSRRPRRSR
jgi:hypothetical protein